MICEGEEADSEQGGEGRIWELFNLWVIERSKGEGCGWIGWDLSCFWFSCDGVYVMIMRKRLKECRQCQIRLSF